MKEIGSEFWEQYPPIAARCADNGAYLLSGRTALRYILEDICRSGKVHKALLPSYCCDSMIIPFLQTGIGVTFYPVHCDSIDYPYGNDADIVFLIDYFGYATDQNSEIARSEKQRGKIIIYDATHRLIGNQNVEMYADYAFCSYRKWFFCNFAKAVKYSGPFTVKRELRQSREYLNIRQEAARKKEQYMRGMPGDKQQFLSAFQAAEEMLDTDYADYAGTPVDADVEMIIARRKINAAYLIRELKGIPQIRLWQETVRDNDTPLFVPILVNPLVRDELRKYLISRDIYCPIHWPKSSYHGECNELYDMELSLVCDQRYDLTDMERMVCAIKDFYR